MLQGSAQKRPPQAVPPGPQIDIQKRLPPFVVDDRQARSSAPGQRRRVVDALAVAAGGFADVLEGRQLLQVDEGRIVAPRSRSPSGYMARVLRCTAPHIALFMTTNSTGSSCMAEA